jgi:hypothetical protein
MFEVSKHTLECVSPYPGIEKCFEGKYNLAEKMWWSANNAALGLEEQDQSILKAVLCHTKVSHFDLLADLTQNLDCYKVGVSKTEIVSEQDLSDTSAAW